MIKKILAPTDFSETSRSAVRYAAAMAEQTHAKLVLLNVYFNPSEEVEIPIFMPTITSFGEYSMDELIKIAVELKAQFGDKLEIEYYNSCGNEVEEINDFVIDHKIDMIVVGMSGAGLVKEHLIGSTTTSLIRKSHCPVMAVSQGMIFKPIKKMALACDYAELRVNKVLHPFLELVRTLDAHIYVLHVNSEFEIKLAERMKVDSALNGFKHSVHEIINGGVVNGINSFVMEHDIDMVVMIARHHLLIDQLLFESDTKRMAFHSKVPLLALHE